MEPLYTTQTANTYEEFKRWNYALNKTRFILLAILLLLFIGIMAAYYLLHLISAATLFLSVFLAALIFAVFIALVSKTIKDTYYSNRSLLKSPVVSVNFYEDRLESDNKQQFSKYDYEDIFKILETKTNFYIMVSANTGIIIVKQNCSQELISFIQKLKNHRK